MSRVFGLLLFFFAAFPIFADIEIQTSINDMVIDGPAELGGSITMSVNDNDFDGVSQENAYFLRIIFEAGALTANTLVDQTSEDASINQPIYLPTRLRSFIEGSTINVPTDAVSIVRWVKGEREIWIRVQADSSSWVSRDGVEGPPSIDDLVSFTIGVSARQSTEDNSGVFSSAGTIPFSTRDLGAGATGDVSAAVSTLLCLDLSNSTLDTRGLDSLLIFDPLFFDASAEVSQGVYNRGNDTGINFTNDFFIGRGRDRVVTATLEQKSGFEPGDVSSGLFAINGLLDLMLDGTHPSPSIVTDLHPGSVLHVRLPQDSSYGFRDNGFRFLGVNSNNGVTEFGDAFELEGQTLYREATLKWTGGSKAIDRETFKIQARLLGSDPNESALALSWEIDLLNHTGASDELPFDGPQQNRRCAPYTIDGPEGTLNISLESLPPFQTLEAQAWIPHITRPGGGFQTRLWITNTNPDPVPYHLIIYGENGVSQQILGEAPGTNLLVLDLNESLSGFPPTHAKIVTNRDQLQYLVSYRAVRSNDTSPAHVSLNAETSRQWRVFTGDLEITWDGLAVINTSNEPAKVSLTVHAKDGGATYTEEIAILEPGGKTLALLSDIPEDRFIDTAYVRISSDQPIHVLALRGNRNSDYLWSNPSVPIQK